jgi:hypothetical protein
LDQEALNIHQVWTRFLNSSFLMTLLNRHAFFVGRHRERLQQGRENTSGKLEPGHLENLVRMVDTLVNLHDMHEPIVTTSAINLSQEKVYHIPD